MRVIALLPMKKESVRVPNKNMKLFAGKPLYHAVMQTLLKSQYVEKVMINTDSEIIADDAQRHFDRVEIVWRPEEIRGDLVPMNRIIAYDLSQSQAEHFVQTHSTNPLLQTHTLDNAISTYFAKNEKYDSLFSVTRLQTRLYWENGEPINHNPEELLRTQDLPPVFEDNSNFYIFSRTSFLASGGNRIGLRAKIFEIDKLEAIDIDTEQEFELAEISYKAWRR